MKETDGLSAYFRNPNTFLAQILHRRHPFSDQELTGTEYRRSLRKTASDGVLRSAASTIAAPLAAVCLTLKFLEDGHSPIYQQERIKSIGTDGELIMMRVQKIRSMLHNSDTPDNYGVTDKENKRITRVGRLLRRFNFDELPQLRNLSLIGIRAIHPNDYETMKKHPGFDAWQKAYAEGEPAIIHPRAVFDRNRKVNESKRYHWDIFYAKHASLGLDLFLLYKFGTRTLRVDKVLKKMFRNRKKHAVKPQDKKAPEVSASAI